MKWLFYIFMILHNFSTNVHLAKFGRLPYRKSGNPDMRSPEVKQGNIMDGYLMKDNLGIFHCFVDASYSVQVVYGLGCLPHQSSHNIIK